MDSTGGTTAEDARVARRSLLKKAAIAGAVAWTAPTVIESVTNPAGALTCAPGNYHVVYQTTLVARTTDLTNIGCTHSGPNVTPASVGMAAAFTGSCSTGDGGNSIAHIASSDGNCRPVRITTTGGCECTITSVWAQVHMRGGGTCPQTAGEYCWQASTGANAPLRITAGAVNSTSITVQPNFVNNTICTGANAAAGIHWGSPDVTNGYLVVNITCTG